MPTNEELEEIIEDKVKEVKDELTDKFNKLDQLMAGHLHQGTETSKINVKDIIRKNIFTFQKEYDNGDSSTAAEINWNNAQKQKITLTGNCTFTFKNPGGPMSGVANFILKVVQDSTGSRTVTWPATVKWPSATAPTLSTGVTDIDIIAFYFDGTNYYGIYNLNFG